MFKPKQVPSRALQHLAWRNASAQQALASCSLCLLFPSLPPHLCPLVLLLQPPLTQGWVPVLGSALQPARLARACGALRLVSVGLAGHTHSPRPSLQGLEAILGLHHCLCVFPYPFQAHCNLLYAFYFTILIAQAVLTGSISLFYLALCIYQACWL